LFPSSGDLIAEAEIIHQHPSVLQPRLLSFNVPRIPDTDLVITNLGARNATMGHGNVSDEKAIVTIPRPAVPCDTSFAICDATKNLRNSRQF
jgi:hypothetical protein